jgi:hypothetical protein
MVNPSNGLTCDQSVNVEGVGLLAGVLAADAIVVALAVAAVVGVAVAAGVTVVGTCSSRNRIKGFLHHRSLLSGSCDGVAIAAGPVGPAPKLTPEQDTRKKLDNSGQIVRHNHMYRQRATRDEECDTNMQNSLTTVSIPSKGYGNSLYL